MGVPPLELQRLFNTRLLAAAGSGRGSLRITLVGLFPAATRDYARAIETRLRAGETVEPVTLDELRASEKARLRAGMADLVLTFAHIRAEVARLLPSCRGPRGELHSRRAHPLRPGRARSPRVLVPGLDLRRLPAAHEGRRAPVRAAHRVDRRRGARHHGTLGAEPAAGGAGRGRLRHGCGARARRAARPACGPSSSATCPIPATSSDPSCPCSTGCGRGCASRPRRRPSWRR